ncbi:MAG: cysteine desulfurase [Candidatus Cloacimonetes bacterium]|nr:cysteine desulfurase [Candidatus Cloacimonadota bacterium]
MNPIYLDNCKTTKPSPEAIEAMREWQEERYYLPANFTQYGTYMQRAIEKFKVAIAGTINANVKEIHFTRGGTEANNIAIKGFLLANADKGTHIICSQVDYPDLLTNAAFFEESGFSVTYLPCDKESIVSPEDLRKAIQPDTVLFMTTLVNHTTGAIQPLAEYRKILDSAQQKIAIHVDASQAYGKLPIDVNSPAIDLMSISGHKIHAPMGIGVLYCRAGTHLKQIVHGVARLDNLAPGGISIAAMAGLVKATEQIFSDREGYENYLRSLTDYLLERVQNEIPAILVNGPLGKGRAAHNMNITFRYIEGEAILLMLDIAGILTSTGSACFSQGMKPNYVMMAMGCTHEESHGSMKFTVSKYTTKEEIDITVDNLKIIVQELRNRSPLCPDELKTV